MDGLRRWLVSLLLLLLLLCASHANAADVMRPRNVVLISVDTLRADALPTLAAADPTLRAWVDDAARFSDAISTASWTLPAHASLLTGLYPDRHGATSPQARIRPQLPTLAMLLRERGFTTVGLVGGGYTDATYGFAAGFERYDGQQVVRAVGDPSLGFSRARSWLDTRRPDDPPFLLFLHTFRVHDYYRGAGEAPSPDEAYACLKLTRPCSAGDWSVLRARYRTTVEATGRDIGALLRTLAARGLLDSTLVILTSDHGEGFDAARRRVHHGGRLDADVLRVPLLFGGPGVQPGERTAPASLVDVLPSVLAALGGGAPSGLDGIALPLAADTTAAPRARFAMKYVAPATDGAATAAPRRLIAVVTADGWFIERGDQKNLYAPADVLQQHDLAADPARLAPFLALAATRAAAPQAPPTVVPDAALRERLRALGYEP